jgi:3-oxoacyl-(acyl-carrier-protein) synthase
MAESATAVRILAYGCLTPLGDAAATHAALLRGDRALRAVPVLGREGGDPVPLALVAGRPLDEETPPAWLGALGRLCAAERGGDWGSPRRPVFLTGSNFGVGSLYALRRFGQEALARWGAPPACAELVAAELGWGPDVTVLSHACVSAHLGLLQASRVLQAGLADQALVVSFDFLSPFVAGGFHALKILNADFPSPYSERPSGAIGLGDGAAFAVLAPDRGEFVIEGQGLFNEMYHFTSNRPDGSGFARCLEVTARAARGRRVWFKGHGTGTLDAGRLEVAAAAAAFPSAPVVGWKGSLGHSLGSCGLVEMAVALESIRSGRVPGTVAGASPPMGLNVAGNAFDGGGFDAAVCASNAFGGAHGSFLVGHA